MCFFCEAEIQHQLAMDHPNICRLLEAGWRDSRGWMIDRAGSLTTENFPFFFRERENTQGISSEIFVFRMWCREKEHTLMENCMKFTRWFQFFFLFTPKLGEGEPNLTVAYFSNGLVQPPTRNCMKSSTLRLENLLV